MLRNLRKGSSGRLSCVILLYERLSTIRLVGIYLEKVEKQPANDKI